MATAQQMATIEAMRVDATAREMMAVGVNLTWDEVDAISGECEDWLSSRLGLRAESDDTGVRYVPAVQS